MIVDAFLGSEHAHERRRAEKVAACCVTPQVRVERGLAPVVIPGRCRDRLCPTCQRYRAREVRRRLEAPLQKADSVRFLTLTMPAEETDLGPRIDRLYTAFRDLRRRQQWKAHVKGGAFFLETTRGREGRHWHVHLHVIIEGDYWSKESIKAEWSAVLGENANIDIRAVHHRRQAAAYVTKYLTKSTELDGWSPETIRDLARGLHRRRGLGTFGRWHRHVIDQQDEPEPKAPLPRHEIGFGIVRAALDSGMVDATKVATFLSRLSPTWRVLMKPYIPDGPELDILCTGADVAELTELLLPLAGATDEPPRAPSRPPPPPPPTLWTDDPRAGRRVI